MPLLLDNKDIGADVKARLIADKCATIPKEVDPDLLDRIWCDIEDALGCPCGIRSKSVIFPGNDKKCIQLKDRCIQCVDYVSIRWGKNGEPRELDECDYSFCPDTCMLCRGSDCCSSKWPKECWIEVHYRHGVDDPAKLRTLRKIAIAAAVRYYQACGHDGRKSVTIGAISETFFPSTDKASEYETLTAAEVYRIERCRP